MVKELISQNHKVILMPLYKSFTDFFLSVYVSRTQAIETGFTFGVLEDVPNITLLDKLLRNCGFIFSRRKAGQSLQSNYVNGAVLKELISND
jgi:glycerol-3-phosphate O-acyltransferase